MEAPDSWRRLGDVLCFVLDSILALRPGAAAAQGPGRGRAARDRHNPGRRQARGLRP